MRLSYRFKSALWLATVVSISVLGIFLQSIELKVALVLISICFACELIDSGLGMGYGTILTPTLLLIGYQPQDIVPTILLSELLSGFAAAFFHQEIGNVKLRVRERDFVPALILISGSVVGVTAGVLIAVSVPKNVLNTGIGCIILGSGLFVVLLSRRVIVYRKWKMLLLSTVASFNKAISGGGYGPLVTSGQILSGVDSKASVGITSFAEAFTCLFAVSLFLIKGGHLNLIVLVPMCTGALASVPFAVFVIKKSSETKLKILIGVVTMSMGLLTLVKAITA